MVPGYFMIIEYENKELCKICGGACCKKCGCDYWPQDFPNLTTNELLNVLEQGEVSVVSVLQIHFNKNRIPIGITPTLLLRARNINRPVIDLLSLKTTCAALRENGCKYESDKRPTGGRLLKPQEKRINQVCMGTPENMQKTLEEWLRYQKVLERVVKRFSGKNVMECLRENIRQLFIDWKQKNFEGVSSQELEEIKSLLPYLKELYPQECEDSKITGLSLKRARNL